MKPSLFLTALVFSGLALNAQNYTNVDNNSNEQQMAYNVNGNPYNNINVQVQTNNVGNRGSSAFQSFGNSNNNTNRGEGNVRQTQQRSTNKPQVQTNVNRGNNFELNENVLDNNIGNENVNRQRGGNIVINDNVQSNPIVNDNKKTVATKPIVQDTPGLSFKPSGLSGRDYSNGGKLKKGQKNFYTQTKTKHKSYFKRKPGNKKVKHHTSKCAKW